MSNNHTIQYNRDFTSITHQDGTKQNNDKVTFKTEMSDIPKPESQNLINNLHAAENQKSKKNKNIKLIVVFGIISLLLLFGIIGIIVFFTYNGNNTGTSTPAYILPQNTINQQFPQDIPQINQQFPQNIPQSNQQFLQNIPQINQQFPQNIPQSNQQFPQNIPQSNQQFPQNIPQSNQQSNNIEFDIEKQFGKTKNKTICLVCILKEQFNNHKDGEINVISSTEKQVITIPTTRPEQLTTNIVIKPIPRKKIDTYELQLEHTLTFVIDITNQFACTYNQFFQCWRAVKIEQQIQTQIEITIPDTTTTCFGIQIACSLLNIHGNFECFKESCNLQNPVYKYIYISEIRRLEWVTPHKVYFKSNTLFTQSYQISTYTFQKIFVNAFNSIPQTTHTSNILVIDLGHQKHCPFNYKKQCWDAKFIADSQQQIQSVQIEVYYIMKNCYFFRSKCPYNVNKLCFKQVCPLRNQTVYLYNTNTKAVTQIIPNDIYTLHTGNFHSSWQNTDTTNLLTLDHIKQAEAAQSLFAEINVNTKQITQQELIIPYIGISLCFNCSTSTYHSKHDAYNNIIIEAEILMNFNDGHYVTQTLLHERVHEFINPTSLNMNKLLYTDNYGRHWYIGQKAVSLVGQGRQLLMQDQAHLGDWGVDVSPSSYAQVYAFLGKYTLAVFEEVGFVSNLKRESFINISKLQRVEMEHSNCIIY